MKNAEIAKLEINQPDLFDSLFVEEQAALLKWIEQNVRGQERRMLKYDSYSLKHFYPRYIENGVMKGALIRCGYIPVDTSRINWKFKKGGERQ